MCKIQAKNLFKAALLGVLLGMVTVLMVGEADGGVPRFVANAPTAPVFISCHADSLTDNNQGLFMLDITTDSQPMTISFWALTAARDTLDKISPLFGATAGDTAITIPAYNRKGYVFSLDRLDAIYISSGTAYLEGE